MDKTVIPYKDSSDEKKKQVAVMFDNIAHKYDFLNHFLSFNIDKIWRRKAIKTFKNKNIESFLDVATGTGDFALEIYKQHKPNQITGIDISEGMLEKGREKIKKKGLSEIISLNKGDSENINFEDNTFDASTVAFGVRNFENLEKGISEIFRVLKPNGECVILEFSNPDKFPVKQMFKFYFSAILPVIGRLFSKDKSAYSYLPESVKVFPNGEKFTNLMEGQGFKNASFRKLFGGVATIYYGKK